MLFFSLWLPGNEPIGGSSRPRKKGVSKVEIVAIGQRSAGRCLAPNFPNFAWHQILDREYPERKDSLDEAVLGTDAKGA
jgi:hypothetical protein